MFIKGMLVGNLMKIADLSKVISLEAKPLEPDRPDKDWVIIASAVLFLAIGSKELILHLMHNIEGYLSEGKLSIDLEYIAEVAARHNIVTTQEKT